MSLKVIKEITLDFSLPKIQNIRCKQHDKDTRIIIIQAATDGKLYKVDKTVVKARYKLLKPDNLAVFNDAKILDDGRIQITLSEQALASSGYAEAELYLVDLSTNEVISTLKFVLIIEKSVIDNQEIESSYEFDALNNILAGEQNRIDITTELENTIKSAEEVRSKSETIRNDNENERIDAESIRKQAESIRKQNESTRIENEDLRKESEQGRCQSEDNREQKTGEIIDEMDNAINRATIISDKCEDLYNTQPFIRVEQKGAMNGVAELDENGLLLTRQVPGAYDDVLEGHAVDISVDTETGAKTATNFVLSGETTECIPESGKIYIDTSTSIQYRWSGTIYVTTGSNIALGETSQTAGRGDWTKTAYEHAHLKDGSNPHGTKYVDSSGDSEKLNGKLPDYYATTEQIENINVNLSDLFLYLSVENWVINGTYSCFSQEIILADMHKNYIPIVSQSFESPIPTELETTEFAKLCGWETKNGSMVFYADTLPTINFTLIVKGTAAKGDAVYGNLNNFIIRIDETEKQLSDHQTQIDSKLSEENISNSTAVTATGEYTLDAVQANASLVGTLANQITALNTKLANLIKYDELTYAGNMTANIPITLNSKVVNVSKIISITMLACTPSNAWVPISVYHGWAGIKVIASETQYYSFTLRIVYLG